MINRQASVGSHGTCIDHFSTHIQFMLRDSEMMRVPCSWCLVRGVWCGVIMLFMVEGVPFQHVPTGRAGGLWVERAVLIVPSCHYYPHGIITTWKLSAINRWASGGLNDGTCPFPSEGGCNLQYINVFDLKAKSKI